MADELLAASYFIPANIENSGTIAQNILAQVAGMRQRDQLNQSLCWSPEDLELLAMFAIEAKAAVARLTTEKAAVEAEHKAALQMLNGAAQAVQNAEHASRTWREQAIQDIEALPPACELISLVRMNDQAISKRAVLSIVRGSNG